MFFIRTGLTPVEPVEFLNLKSISSVSRWQPQFLFDVGRSGNANRLRSLKTLPTKSTPVYSLRVRSLDAWLLHGHG